MSGGHFNYLQSQVAYLISELERFIKEEETYPEYVYPPETKKLATAAMHHLKLGEIMVQRLDRFVSYDDGSECFRKRLGNDLVTYLLDSDRTDF